jgi:hypothetical protein
MVIADIPIGYYHNPIIQKRRKKCLAMEVVEALLNEAEVPSRVVQMDPENQRATRQREQSYPEYRILMTKSPETVTSVKGGLFFADGWLPATGKFILGEWDEIVGKVLSTLLGVHAPEDPVEADRVMDRLIREGLIGFFSDDPGVIIVVSAEEHMNLTPSQQRQIARFFKPDTYTAWEWIPSMMAKPRVIDPDLSLGLKFDAEKRRE